MSDQEVLFRVLRSFARTMADGDGCTDVLTALSEHVVDVVGAAAAGIGLCEGDEIRFVAATDCRALEAEAAQERLQMGPGHTALAEGRPVPVADVREHAADGTEYCRLVEQAGFSSVLGIPLVLDDHRVGSLNVYDVGPRAWSEDSIAAATVLADIGTAFVLNGSDLAQSRQTTRQLQGALDSRVVLEQAKGKLAGLLGVSPAEAFDVIRRYARSHQETVQRIAQTVLDRGADAVADGERGHPPRERVSSR